MSHHLRILELRSHTGDVQIIKTTDEHPFWVPAAGWVPAGELQEDQQIRQADGAVARILRTEFELHLAGIEAFNMQVEDFHTYFVAAHGTRAGPVLVHNADGETHSALGKKHYKPVLPKGRSTLEMISRPMERVLMNGSTH